MKIIWITAIFALLAFFTVSGEEQASPIEWSFSAELNLAPGVLDEEPRIYDNLKTSFRYSWDFFHLIADLSLRNDERYSPDEVYWLGRYFYLNQGGILLDFDLLSLKAGRFIHRDFLETPYSLFISSEDLPAVMADITFQGGFFTYESRWIRLNTRSSASTSTWYPDGFPDRGANYKVFAFQFGDFRFGLQDSAVYVDRVFDEEYFFSPIPHIFTQLSRYSGKPWSEDINDNSITGLFFDWRRPLFYVYAQWLVDDISLDFLIPDFLRDRFGGRGTKVPSKLAWSLGGYYDFPFGRLGFYHAGATKYTFAATNNDLSLPYEYAYYPAVEYLLADTTTWMILEYTDNYIGYKYGENNIAFLVEYANTFLGVQFNANIEYVISGSKSPANPWHEADVAGDYTLLLDDAVLEHTISTRVRAAWNWRNWTFYGNLRLGGVFNRLGLEAATDTGPDIFRPQPGLHKLIYELAVGATYTWKMGKSRK